MKSSPTVTELLLKMNFNGKANGVTTQSKKSSATEKENHIELFCRGDALK
jgi:hypothetical protein